MTYYMYTDELYHHGIKGMKWGVRRYQNKNGTYTSAGKQRRTSGGSSRRHIMSDRAKKALKIGVGIAGTAALGYGLYKLNKDINQKNFEIAVQAGQELSDRLFDEVRAKVPTNTPIPGMGLNRYAINQQISAELKSDFAGQATDKILKDSRSPIVKTRNAIYMNKVYKGQAFANDLFSYDKIANYVYNANKVAEGGQSMFAKRARDVLNTGGSYPEGYKKGRKQLKT